MPTISVKDGGTWKEAKEILVKDSGTWKAVKEVHVKDGGTWKKAFPESGTQTYSSAGTYSFTVPNGIYSLTVPLMVGGGGGGAGFYGSGDNHAGGGGGSGGYYENQTIAVTPGETLTIIVGAKGGSGSFEFNGNFICVGTAYGTSGGGATYSDGTAGGDTIIKRSSTELLKATGGEGGKGAGPGDNMGESRSGVGGSPNGVTGATPNPNRNSYSATAGGDNGKGYGVGGNGNASNGTCPTEGGLGYVSLSW
jgi:hypothetical protein